MISFLFVFFFSFFFLVKPMPLRSFVFRHLRMRKYGFLFRSDVLSFLREVDVSKKLERSLLSHLDQLWLKYLRISVLNSSFKFKAEDDLWT